MLSSLGEIFSGNFGFEIEESMSGYHQYTEEADRNGIHPISFTAKWGPESIPLWLNPFDKNFLRHPMHGTVTVGGLCSDIKFSGYMELRYFRETLIRYVFDFTVDQDSYHFHGEKQNLRPWNLARTHTTLRGTLSKTNSQTTVSRAKLYFHFQDLLPMLSSFRLRL
jgi:hypothetical protein